MSDKMLAKMPVPALNIEIHWPWISAFFIGDRLLNHSVIVLERVGKCDDVQRVGSAGGGMKDVEVTLILDVK